MNNKPRDEIEYTRRGQFTMPGVMFVSHIVCTAQILCIGDQTESFRGRPDWASIQHGYECLAVEKAHTTDIMG
jgi:hypothetical protein